MGHQGYLTTIHQQNFEDTVMEVNHWKQCGKHDQGDGRQQYRDSHAIAWKSYQTHADQRGHLAPG